LVGTDTLPERHGQIWCALDLEGLARRAAGQT
jgi:hypothetical protein